MAPTFSDADAKLVADLERLAIKTKKLVKSSSYPAPADPNVQVRSWKLDEWKYYEVPSPFPTLARGLFSQWIPEGELSESDGGGKHRIVARGYDKFFNIGEVPWTSWAALEAHTSPPYALTLKSNGCIIFIAALTPSKLLITSKHSLGPVVGAPESHAQVGERWLLKHLGQKSKTPEEFAQVLWDNNWTAVAELCDDNFEEHVLPYSPEKTGLHLHGLNNSTGVFHTQPPKAVAAFANEWGFIETISHSVNSIPEVKAFTDEVAKAGTWNGEAVEGFVVRCHVSESTSSGDQKSAPPYPPGSSFFFKVKFDEPYMTYRDWREMTKMLLTAHTKGNIEDAKVHKSKLRRPESHLYRQWVSGEIKKDPKQFENFGKGKGIIATRERFLKWLEAEKGIKMWANPQEASLENSRTQPSINGNDGTEVVKEPKGFGKTIIIPVAIPGCGKTTIAVALKHLFGFGHTQSDDVHVKKAAPMFIKNVKTELMNHGVVIADKNNHQQRHRRDLRDAIANMNPPVRLVAFNWSLRNPPAIVHRICADRIMHRGENHQTLRADAVARNHEEVIWRFIQNSEPLDDSEVDEVVEMEPDEDIEQGLDRAIDACVRILGVTKPTQEQVGQALAVARGYQPVKKKGEDKQKKAQPRYYGFLPEFDLEDVVSKRLAEGDATTQVKKFWESLKKDDRVAKRPHVTIVHSKSLPQEQDLWDTCQHLFMDQSPPTFELRLSHLIYNDRVMAISVDDIKVATDGGADTHEDGHKFANELDPNLKRCLHITVGTSRSDIAAFEARAMVDAWRRGQSKGNGGAIPLDNVVAKGRVKGLFS